MKGCILLVMAGGGGLDVSNKSGRSGINVLMIRIRVEVGRK